MRFHTFSWKSIKICKSTLYHMLFRKIGSIFLKISLIAQLIGFQKYYLLDLNIKLIQIIILIILERKLTKIIHLGKKSLSDER